MQLEEYKDVGSGGITVSRLLELAKDVDFGCLVGLRIIRGENVDTIMEPGAILAFDFEEYVKEHHEECSRFTFLLDFEKEAVVVDVQKNAGGTEKHLLYNMSVMRCGACNDEKDGLYRFCTMFEVHLTTAEEDNWEARYMLDEMTEDAAFCDYASSLDDSLRFSLYWGMKFYNNGAYLQALVCLKRAYNGIKDPEEDNAVHLYCFVSEMIGSIYLRIGMPDAATTYLMSIAMGVGVERSYPLMASCFSCLNEISALRGLQRMRISLLGSIAEREESGADFEELMKSYLFINRKIVELLIKRGKEVEAREFLEDMIKNEEDVDYAMDMLAKLDD